MKVIETVDLHKTYQETKVPVKAVRGISLKFEEGEFTAVVGPSGSGKSKLVEQVCAQTNRELAHQEGSSSGFRTAEWIHPYHRRSTNGTRASSSRPTRRTRRTAVAGEPIRFRWLGS